MDVYPYPGPDMAEEQDKAGRPPIVESPAEFIVKAEAYMAECERQDEPPTLTGLVLSMGFASRQSFYDYVKRDGFSYATQRSRLLVENAYEKRLHGNSVAGAIFALKNMGWSDKQEHEVSGPGGSPLAVSVTRTIVHPDDADG